MELQGTQAGDGKLQCHQDLQVTYSQILQRIFILEGLFSICFAVVAFLIIPRFPADATFLQEDEKAYLLRRLDAKRGKEKITFRSIKWKQCFFDWKVWACVSHSSSASQAPGFTEKKSAHSSTSAPTCPPPQTSPSPPPFSPNSVGPTRRPKSTSSPFTSSPSSST